MVRGALRSHHFGVSLPPKPICQAEGVARTSARLPVTLARASPLFFPPLLAQRPSLLRREAEPPARRPPIGSSSPKLPRVLLESAFHISCGLQKWPWAAGEGREEGKRWLAVTSSAAETAVPPSGASHNRPFRSRERGGGAVTDFWSDFGAAGMEPFF